jgi:hypothetical protein
MNIIPKHDGHATVASFDSQNRQRGESQEIAAPQLGQFRVSAFIGWVRRRSGRRLKLTIAEAGVNRKNLSCEDVPRMNEISH